ncbi:MAG: response regulator, partial [Bacteroidota bacterium]
VNNEEDILWDIAKNCIRELGFVDAVIYTLDPVREVLIQRAAYGNKEDGEFAIYEPIEIPLGEGIVGSVALTGKAEIVANTSEDSRYILDDAMRLSELAVPIIGPRGILGVIDSEHPEPGFYTDEHLAILTTIASIAANKILRARTVEALEKAKEKAEQATAAKSNFLSSMSHEIRTPLNAVIGISHLLAEELSDTEHLMSLETLLSSAEHLLSLINDILDFSKIEAGKLVLNPQSFSLQHLLENMAGTFSFLAEEKGLKLLYERSAKLHSNLYGDDTRLRQILTNLLGNALKFTSQGELALGCELISESTSEQHLRFWVKDSGIGIPPERQGSIFDSFTQAEEDTSRNFGGTGLGLAISQKLVELQDGKIWLESNHDIEQGPTGTTFWFELRYPKSEQSNNLNKSTAQSLRDLPPLKGLSVLLVEDNRVNVMVAKRFLQRWEIECSHAANGLFALQALQSNTFDLVLMDLNMPVMGGIEATEHIRAKGNQIPILALTADASAEIREKVFASGMNGYITKPFQPSHLHSTLAEYRPIEK